MKKAAVIVFIFLFFLLLLGAVLFKVLGPSSPNTADAPPVQFPVATATVGVTEQDPVQFARAFYIWYLENYYRDHDFPYYENQNQILAPWLTSNFLADWDQILLEVEVNPVLLTAEDPTLLGTEITGSLASQSIRTSVVYLTIGSGENTHAYNVSLVKDSDGMWKISGVASTI